MKTASRMQILDGVEQILGDAILSGEEVDVTAEKIYKYGIEPLRLALEQENQMLVSIAYEANNHARRLLNTHDTNNEQERKKIDERAKYLAKHYADNGGFKIVQS